MLHPALSELPQRILLLWTSRREGVPGKLAGSLSSLYPSVHGKHLVIAEQACDVLLVLPEDVVVEGTGGQGQHLRLIQHRLHNLPPHTMPCEMWQTNELQWMRVACFNMTEPCLNRLVASMKLMCSPGLISPVLLDLMMSRLAKGTWSDQKFA